MTDLDMDQIQGNILAGFNKDHQVFLVLRFTEAALARSWLAEVTGEVATVAEVEAYNTLFKTVHRRRGHASSVVQATWMNLAISAAGLAFLDVPQASIDQFPQAFRDGLAARAEGLGHIGPSAPETWRPAFRTASVHAVMIVAADDPDDLDEAIDRYMVQAGAHGVDVADRLDGRARLDERGHEHFGFKDGVSQPGILGFTPEGSVPGQGDPGQDLIQPGEFVIGYPTQPGTPFAPPPTPPAQYGQPAPDPAPVPDPEAPGPNSDGGPDWTVNGSFLVIQRLLQDVARFDADTTNQAGAAGVDVDLFRAKLVGRHKSGCPMEEIDGHPGAPTADIGLTDPAVLSDDLINDFEYQDDDADGTIVPRASHIRKAYPRDEVPPGELNVQPHRILRRGIAFGDSYRATAPEGAPGHAAAERGLLFACYQSDIERQFEFIQQSWVNNPNFPQAGDGADPILAEAACSFTLPGTGPLDTGGWITMSGGEYFFSPSIDALGRIASGGA